MGEVAEMVREHASGRTAPGAATLSDLASTPFGAEGQTAMARTQAGYDPRPEGGGTDGGPAEFIVPASRAPRPSGGGSTLRRVGKGWGVRGWR